jgi:type I restriction enzyme R subunit
VITEDHLEQLALTWFQETGWAYLPGPDIAPEAVASERTDYGVVVLKARLAAAVARLNPKLPAAAVDEVVHLATTSDHPSLIQSNRAFHRMLTDGVKIEYTNADGKKETDFAQLIDFRTPSNNDFLVVNQFTITGTKRPRRPDIIVFVNGLPLGVVELKNPADVNADVWEAYAQIQTYKEEIEELLFLIESCLVRVFL